MVSHFFFGWLHVNLVQFIFELFCLEVWEKVFLYKIPDRSSGGFRPIFVRCSSDFRPIFIWQYRSIFSDNLRKMQKSIYSRFTTPTPVKNIKLAATINQLLGSLPHIDSRSKRENVRTPLSTVV